MRPYLLVLALIAALVSCGGRRITPAPTADRVVGDKYAAQDEQNGVRLVFDSQWKGDPDQLESVVTPLRVTITNNSGHPLRLGYRDFGLITDTGYRAVAVPPFEIRGNVEETQATTIHPAFGWSGFYPAPFYSPFYGPYYRTWGGPWAFDAPYYTAYTTWARPLPTQDMLKKALPEGVLENGGTVTGYIYFQRIPENATGVNFEAKLIDAETEAPVANLTIPFVVSK